MGDRSERLDAGRSPACEVERITATNQSDPRLRTKRKLLDDLELPGALRGLLLTLAVTQHAPDPTGKAAELL
jgi:hypothetical protein